MFNFNANLNPARNTALSAYHDLILLAIGFEFVASGALKRNDNIHPCNEWVIGLDCYPYQIKAYSYQNNILLVAKDLHQQIDYNCPFDLVLADKIEQFQLIPDHPNERRQILTNQLNNIIRQINKRLND